MPTRYGDAPEISGAMVAGELGLEPAEFRQLMESGKIKLLCERGTGDDDGLYRATFYFGERRARFVIDRHGRLADG